MNFLKSDLNIDFFKFRKATSIFSIVMVLGSIIAIATQGLNFGLDFTGGTLVQVKYEKNANLSEIRKTIQAAGFDKIVVQNFGTSREVMIRLAPVAGKEAVEIGNDVVTVLRKATDENVVMQKIDFVSASVGEELTEQGGLAIIVALIGILIYVSLRFEWKLALGSVVALAHDVIIVVGFFAITQREFDLTVLAALLAVIGYSLNDTIVVFDRIRENFLKLRKQDPIEVVNGSLNQTLSRTIITSFTTLIVVLALFFLGGETIHGFSSALIAGILIGTYSSVYVASNSALALGISKEDLMPSEVEIEGADQEALL